MPTLGPSLSSSRATHQPPGPANKSITVTTNVVTVTSTVHRAMGGPVFPGFPTMVGEQGPELAYSGSQNLNIAPLSSAAPRPVTVHNQFIVDAPGGTISRQSQMQTAAAAARTIGQANRRNNQ